MITYSHLSVTTDYGDGTVLRLASHHEARNLVSFRPIASQ